MKLQSCDEWTAGINQGISLHISQFGQQMISQQAVQKSRGTDIFTIKAVVSYFIVIYSG